MNNTKLKSIRYKLIDFKTEVKIKKLDQLRN